MQSHPLSVRAAGVLAGLQDAAQLYQQMLQGRRCAVPPTLSRWLAAPGMTRFRCKRQA